MAVSNSGTTYTETAVALTKTAPSAATEGQGLKGLTSIQLVIVAPTSQTFTGGSMQCHVYDPSVALWARLPSGDFTVPSGSRVVAFDPVEIVANRNARVIWCSASVTMSGGTTMTIHQLGFDVKRAHRYGA